MSGTPLEHWFRQRGGGAAYSDSFVEHYLVLILYPSSLSHELQWGLGGLLLLVNLTVYLLVFHRRARPYLFAA